MIEKIKDKYSHQLYLFLSNDIEIINKTFSDGVTVEMKRNAKDYGI